VVDCTANSSCASSPGCDLLTLLARLVRRDFPGVHVVLPWDFTTYNDCDIEGKPRRPSKEFEGEEAFGSIVVLAQRDSQIVHTAKYLQSFGRYVAVDGFFLCCCHGWLCAISI